jgi:hypothetical protein
MERLIDAFEQARKQTVTTPDNNHLMPLGNILDQAITATSGGAAGPVLAR